MKIQTSENNEKDFSKFQRLTPKGRILLNKKKAIKQTLNEEKFMIV